MRKILNSYPVEEMNGIFTFRTLFSLNPVTTVNTVRRSKKPITKVLTR